MVRALIAGGMACGFAFAGGDNYVASVERWRATREAALKAEDGWLAVAGLFWLNEGDNAAGAAAGSDIALPGGPARLGVFSLNKGLVTFRAADGVDVKIDGKAATEAALRTDAEATPDTVETGELTMFAIQRGERYAIRLRDKNSEMRRNFTGLRWYPVQERYRVMAVFHTYPETKTILVPNILGEKVPSPSPGYAEFDLNGEHLRLQPVLEGTQLFFVFRDKTAGRTTYGSGRFLYSDLAKDGKVTLDFNKAYNPPCAFTPYATCPLPIPENRMPVVIEAGELNYGSH